jgi:hypothetical protein
MQSEPKFVQILRSWGRPESEIAKAVIQHEDRQLKRMRDLQESAFRVARTAQLKGESQ